MSRPGLVLGLIGALALGKYVAMSLSVRMFGGSRASTKLVWSLSIP